MSARSPRTSLSGASSAEVADDFGDSLKDLQANNRYEINNFTLIAKENTEHAQAISKTLENHIKSISPPRKLPALFVLDSIVKNVGTPYTVYLGRALYSTFMDAYTLVDGTTRRQMEAMLKTWKEPVPGSMDSRPVFSAETVRPIENALIKARTAALQSSRPGPPQQEYRSTPTPPQYNSRYGPPQGSPQPQPYRGYGSHQATPQQQPPYQAPPNFPPTPTQQQQFPYAPPPQQPPNELDTLKRDVAALISSRQAQFGANVFDPGLRQQLEALLALQDVLNKHQLGQPQMQQIRSQVSALSAAGPPPSNPTPQPTAPPPQQWQPPPPIPQSLLQNLPLPPASFPQPPSQPPSAPPQPAAPALGPGALNALQALMANGQKPGTPQLRAAAPDLQNASHAQLNNVQNQNAAAPAVNGADLIASLTRNGLLPNAASKPTPSPSAPPMPSTTDLLKSLQGVIPPSHTGTPTGAPSLTTRPRIPMTAAALKTPRPELIHALYAQSPNQCTTCGRRFPATDRGREHKARHLDWHFRTNQRLADPATNRGRHRNWFPSELEWVTLKEYDPSTTTAGAAGGEGGSEGGGATLAAKKAKDPAEQTLRAPAGVTRCTCSVCFEEMKSAYSEVQQDWVFVNAARLGGKIVHATCAAEMVKGAQQQQQQQGGPMGAALKGGVGRRERSGTPESSLGKRKAGEGGLVQGGGGKREA